MKTKLFLVALFALFAFKTHAQSDYSTYLNKAMEKLETGDCESAQKFYNVYKDLSGESKPSVQVLIDDCNKNKRKLYVLGQKVYYNGRNYIVVYLSDEGEHGFAVYDEGRQSLSKKMIDEHLIPSANELSKIRNHRDVINVYDDCWSYSYHSYDVGERYKYVDFNSGYVGYDYKPKKKRILLIYRF